MPRTGGSGGRSRWRERPLRPGGERRRRATCRIEPPRPLSAPRTAAPARPPRRSAPAPPPALAPNEASEGEQSPEGRTGAEEEGGAGGRGGEGRGALGRGFSLLLVFVCLVVWVFGFVFFFVLFFRVGEVAAAGGSVSSCWKVMNR